MLGIWDAARNRHVSPSYRSRAVKKSRTFSVMSEADLRVEIRRLTEANTILRRERGELQKRLDAVAEVANNGALDLRVTSGGSIGVFGLRRFPITLFKGEALKILSAADQIRAFIRDNDGLSQGKDDPRYQSKVKKKGRK